jgi:hypothetical protein
MKWLQFLFVGFLISFVFNVFGAERLFIPFLDPASQSNVTVTVSDFGKGQPCPPEFTNSVSNTNLFTQEEQQMIQDIFVKYKNVTTNSGPPGTILINFYKTNFIIQPIYWMKTNDWNRRRTNELWVSNFQYTNSESKEEIRFGGGISATFTDKLKNGYNASFAWVGDGTLLTVSEQKHGLHVGFLARFSDLHPQGISWDYRRADFSDAHLEEYMQMTNGMVLGKWLMWNPRDGNLMLEAESKEPYDWNNHRQILPN